ncbi:MAG: nucleotidyltransferase [Alphaproteobacteria bacterium CG11_big_fil_rev_8_21_14_0_20_44_7]|nr:MAG: nucleotidyltransferase [Alphaproteobacteria bacterium CG11_big_fil_rev_8_21_14_0_20_44_7]
MLANKDRILEAANKYHASDIKLFGSFLRGEETENSDVDFLVKWDENASLTDWSGLKRELEELLGRKVDIATEKSLHWYIRDKVMSEARPI